MDMVKENNVENVNKSRKFIVEKRAQLCVSYNHLNWEPNNDSQQLEMRQMLRLKFNIIGHKRITMSHKWLFAYNRLLQHYPYSAYCEYAFDGFA